VPPLRRLRLAADVSLGIDVAKKDAFEQTSEKGHGGGGDSRPKNATPWSAVEDFFHVECYRQQQSAVQYMPTAMLGLVRLNTRCPVWRK
jgi:hypothetical protein